MCVCDSLRHSEVWLPTRYSILLLIYLNSRSLGKSGLVSVNKLIPHDFISLHGTFVRNKCCENGKRFHDDFVIPCDRYLSTSYEESFATNDEAIAVLCNDRHNWWCAFCDRPLFKETKCLFFQVWHYSQVMCSLQQIIPTHKHFLYEQ